MSGFGLAVIEKDWLAKHKYIVDDAVSMADIMCYEELVQLRWWGVVEDFASKYPNTNRWLDRMAKLPCHDECHAILDKLKPFLAQRQVQMKDFISKL